MDKIKDYDDEKITMAWSPFLALPFCLKSKIESPAYLYFDEQTARNMYEFLRKVFKG